jgi:hypothetical protein
MIRAGGITGAVNHAIRQLEFHHRPLAAETVAEKRTPGGSPADQFCDRPGSAQY